MLRALRLRLRQRQLLRLMKLLLESRVFASDRLVAGGHVAHARIDARHGAVAKQLTDDRVLVLLLLMMMVMVIIAVHANHKLEARRIGESAGDLQDAPREEADRGGLAPARGGRRRGRARGGEEAWAAAALVMPIRIWRDCRGLCGRTIGAGADIEQATRR